MLSFELLTRYVSRLRIPFDGIDTAVFLIRCGTDYALFDCGSDAQDVEQYLLPALARLDIVPVELIVSHAHADHCGGVTALTNRFPELRLNTANEDLGALLSCPRRIVTGGDVIRSCLEVVRLPGHTADCIGILDHRTQTLLTGDALQQDGVGRYGTSFESAQTYCDTIRWIAKLPLRQIIASHNYAPLGSQADGAEAIAQYLEASQAAIDRMVAFVLARRTTDPETIAVQYNANHPTLPPIAAPTVKVILEE